MIKHRMHRHIHQTGFSLIELVIAIGVFVMLIAGVTFLTVGGSSPFTGASDSRAMERFAREAAEILNAVTEQNWTQIADHDDSSSVKLAKDGSGNWTVAAGTETRGSFTRDIKLVAVQRDATGTIVASGTTDPSTVKAVITVSASGRASYVIEAFLTNWQAYRMSQTDWSGSSGTTLWSAGTSAYSSSSTMNGMNPAGDLKIASST